MVKALERYENVYKRLKKCFDVSFGDGKKNGCIPINEVKRLVLMRRREDKRNNLPENTLIEVPGNLFQALEETYISRDSDCVSGPIGCAETPEEQLDGIINMALLMYLSNHLSKHYRFKSQEENMPSDYKKAYKRNEGQLLTWKNIAITDIIASIYILAKTSEEYEEYFSYGERKDDSNQPTFVIDLPYIGQLCVHFGSEYNKETIVQNAKDTVKSILEKKVELGQITEEERQKIIIELDEKGVLPEYEGKLYEYVGAMPIEYIGENIKKYRKIMGNKLPEDITSEDIQNMAKKGLNQRELYYYFIKMGAPKRILKQIFGITPKITPNCIEEATHVITMGDFSQATQDLKEIALDKKNERINPTGRT